MRKIVYLTSILVVLLSSLYAQKSVLINDPNLVVYYDFDDIINHTLPDISKNGLNGYINNGTIAIGKEGESIKFNDSTSYVAMGNNQKLQVKQLTLMAWVKPYSLGSDIQRIEILEKTDAYWMNIRNGNKEALKEERGKLRVGGFFVPDGSSEKTWLYMDSKDVVEINVWSHAAFTFDGDKMRSYINGNLQNEKATPSALFQSDYLCSVGCKTTKDNTLEAIFHGLIDELVILSRALSQEEIDAYLGVISSASENRVPLGGRVYPNPASGVVYYEPFESSEIYNIEIIDINGKTVISKQEGNAIPISINIEHLERGLYLMRVNNHISRLSVE